MIDRTYRDDPYEYMSQEPCDYYEERKKEGLGMTNDLISRSALKRDLEISPYNDYDDYLRTERLIDNAPTVEERSKGEWIAISERLPVHRDWYLGTFREPNTGFIGLPFICDYVGKVTKGTTKEGWILRGFTDIDNACDYYKSLECIAWQPLPEPYKKGGETNEAFNS